MNATLKCRWYQFSLRSLLLLTTGVCVGMGWLAYELNEVRKREAVLAESRKLELYEKVNLYVSFDENKGLHQAWLCPTLSDKSVGKVVAARFVFGEVCDADLSLLSGMSKLEDLWISHPNVTDAGLVHIAGLTELKSVRLNASPVGDSGLVNLRRFNKLKELNLYGTKITDSGLVNIAGLTKLEQLGLAYTKVTDAGLIHLADLKELKVLDLAYTQVSDAGLPHLAALTNLERLELRETKVTYQGADELRKTRPKLCVLSHY